MEEQKFLSSVPSLSKAQSVYLDFVRAAAAMLVLIGHGSILFMNDGFLRTLHIEAIGVLIFFILSGFFISYTVFRNYHNPNYRFRDFFTDRFARIYCAFLPALFFVWSIDYFSLQLPLPTLDETRAVQLDWILKIDQNSNVQTFIGNLLMLQDFPLFQVIRRVLDFDTPWFISNYGSASPFWTISIEWWIYMCFGVITILCLRDRVKLKLWHYPVLAVPFIVALYFLIGGTDNCLTLLWILGVGICLLFIKMSAIRQYFNPSLTSGQWKKYCLYAFFAGLAFMGGRALSIKLDQGEFNLPEFQFALFLCIAVFSLFFLLDKVDRVPAALEKFCRFVADYSFSLYLTHASVLAFLYLIFRAAIQTGLFSGWASSYRMPLQLYSGGSLNVITDAQGSG